MWNHNAYLLENLEGKKGLGQILDSISSSRGPRGPELWLENTPAV